MIPTSPEHDDDLLERELVSYQECLDSGGLSALEPKDRMRQDLPPEIEESLSGLKHCLDLLNQTRLESATPEDRHDSASASQFIPSGFALPEKIGKFEITEMLGFGGFGIVYKGVDPSTQREVAIKIPKPERLANSDSIQRFAREASLVAQLDHPNIVPIYACDQHGAIPYIVMPFVQGESLHEWIRNQEVIPFRTAAEIVRQLAEGVAHAHDRNVLHRDITPVNILLEPMKGTPSSKSGLTFLPRLMDFGIAKSIDASRGGTITGATIGTVGYMSPEQACGKLQEIRETTDVYGLGTVLYELICGIPPFRGENDTHTLEMLLRDEVRPPDFLRQGVPRDLATICLKCLEKSPSRRYHSAGELADDLRRFLGGEPIRAKPASLMDHAVRWCRRNPVKSSLVLVSGLALTGLVSISLWYNSRLTNLLEISEANRTAVLAQSAEIRRRACLSDVRLSQLVWNQGHAEQAIRLLERHRPIQGETDVRHFAWWHLWRQYTESSQLLGDHAGGASAVAISADGKWGASGGKDSLIRMYSLPGGQELATIRSEVPSGINALDFSPSGKHLASATDSHNIQIWEAATQKLVWELQGHTESVLDVAYSPDGKTVASAGGDMIVRLWDAATGSLRGVLSGHTKAITGIAFHPHESLLASTAKDGTIRLWDLNTLSPDKRLPDGIIKLEKPGDWCRPIIISPDGKFLVGGTIISEVLKWSLESSSFGKLIDQNNEMTNARCLAWPKEGSLIIGQTTNGIRVADSSTLKNSLTYLKRHTKEVDSVAATGDGSLIMSASNDGTVRLWMVDSLFQRLEKQASFPKLPDERLRLYDPNWSKKGFGVKLESVRTDRIHQSLEVGVGEESCYCFLDGPNGTLRKTIECRRDDKIAMSPSGNVVLFYNRDGNLRLIRTESFREAWHVQIPPYAVEQLQKPYVVIHESEQFALLCWGNELLKIALEDGTILHRIEYPARILQAAFGQWKTQKVAIVACFDGTIVFWDPQELQTVEQKNIPQQEEMTAVAMSEDGAYLASGTLRGVVNVWNCSDWSSKAEFVLPDVTMQLGFLKGSRILVTRSRLFNLWDIENQALLLAYPGDSTPFMGHTIEDRILMNAAFPFAISPDNTKIAFPVFNQMIVVDTSLGN